jgi:hypothetical protein
MVKRDDVAMMSFSKGAQDSEKILNKKPGPAR